MPPKKKPPHEGKHRAPDQPGDTVTTRGEPRRARSPRHGEPSEPRRPRARASAPVSATPVTAPIPHPPRPAVHPPARPRGDGGRRREALGTAAREYGYRHAMRSGNPNVRPSTVGGGVAGALSGAAAGGSVAGPAGAAVGGVAGALGGAAGAAKAKKAYDAAKRASNGQVARRVLVAEFAICVVIAALSPLTDRKRSEPPGAFMKRMAAIMGLFLILALVSAMGRNASRVSAGLGGLITVTLVVSERDLFTTLAGLMKSTNDPPAAGTGPDDGDVGEQIGEDLGGLLGQIPGMT